MQSAFNYDLWKETYDPDFTEISRGSRVPDKWMNFDMVSEKYQNSIIKPLNPYMEYMASPPKLISIVGNTITLQYQNFADIYIKRRRKGYLYNSERPWIRQYYQTKDQWGIMDGTATEAFKAITTWIIDANVSARVYEAENSPFIVPEDTIVFEEIPKDCKYLSPQFVKFKFKAYGNHMKNNGLVGELIKCSPFFNIEFEADDIIVERVRKFYEEE